MARKPTISKNYNPKVTVIKSNRKAAVSPSRIEGHAPPRKPQKTELELLEIQLQIARKRVASLNAKIRDFKNNIELPNLKKKYEGKYFEFPNSNGNGVEWPVYVNCKRVINIDAFIIDRFESQPDKIFEFRIDEEHYGLWLFQKKQITKKKYEAELAKFKKLALGLSALTIPMTKREINKFNKLK